MFDIPVLYEAWGHRHWQFCHPVADMSVWYLAIGSKYILDQSSWSCSLWPKSKHRHWSDTQLLFWGVTAPCSPRETDNAIQLLVHLWENGDIKLHPEVHINARLQFLCLVANYRVALDRLRLYTPKTHLAVAARQAAFHSYRQSTPDSMLMRSLSHCQVRRINQVIFSPEVDWSSTVISMPYNVFFVNIRLY